MTVSGITETVSSSLTLADVEWSGTRASALFAVGGARFPFFVEATEPLDPSPDPFVALGLLPAMRLGTPLQLPPGVSPRLLAGASRVQGLYRIWQNLPVIPVETEPRDPGGRGGSGVGAFLSGGVDSFFTVLRHRAEITHLFFVHGFDFRPSGEERLQRQAAEMARAVADELGVCLIEVWTDMRFFSNRFVLWDDFYGSALAAVALLFQGTLGRVLVPGGVTYENLYARGSHPMLDPLFSTEQLEILYDGEEVRRVEKVAYIADHQVAMDWLRICYRNPDQTYNCGCCEKCLRTRVSLRAVGAESRCRTLPPTISTRDVVRIPIRAEYNRHYTRDNLREVERRGNDPELAGALQKLLRADRRRAALAPLRQVLAAPVRRIAPHGFGQRARDGAGPVGRWKDR